MFQFVFSKKIYIFLYSKKLIKKFIFFIFKKNIIKKISMGNIFSSCTNYINGEIFRPPNSENLYAKIDYNKIYYNKLQIPYVFIRPENMRNNKNLAW